MQTNSNPKNIRFNDGVAQGLSRASAPKVAISDGYRNYFLACREAPALNSSSKWRLPLNVIFFHEGWVPRYLSLRNDVTLYGCDNERQEFYLVG